MEEPMEATSLILDNAKRKITSKEPLTEVEKVILREYVILCRANLQELSLKNKTQQLEKDDLEKIGRLNSEISLYGGD